MWIFCELSQSEGSEFAFGLQIEQVTILLSECLFILRSFSRSVRGEYAVKMYV